MESQVEELMKRYPSLTKRVCKDMIKRDATEAEFQRRHEEECAIKDLKERFPIFTWDVCKEMIKKPATEEDLNSRYEEELRVKEMQERFPAFSSDLCKEMLAIVANEIQLKMRNEREKIKATQNVNAFIPDMEPSDSPHKILNIVLVGKTGVGKSATGNLIVGEECFEASSSTQSVTDTIDSFECDINGVTVRVVDTPGFVDTDKEDESIATELLKVGLFCEEGIHAFIFLRSLGNTRCTPEEKKAFEDFKQVFSTEVLGHCLFLFTRAKEVLQMNDLEDNTIKGWVNQNLIGDEVYKGVNYRVLGVENLLISPLERQMQRERLICYIQWMLDDTGGKPFDLDIFLEAKNENKEAIRIAEEIAKEEREKERELERENIIRIEIPKAVKSHLMYNTRNQLAKIALGKGTFSEDVEELCKDRFMDYRGTVERLLQSFAATLVSQTYIGRMMKLAVVLFGFAIK